MSTINNSGVEKNYNSGVISPVCCYSFPPRPPVKVLSKEKIRCKKVHPIT